MVKDCMLCHQRVSFQLSLCVNILIILMQVAYIYAYKRMFILHWFWILSKRKLPHRNDFACTNHCHFFLENQIHNNFRVGKTANKMEPPPLLVKLQRVWKQTLLSPDYWCDLSKEELIAQTFLKYILVQHK